MITVQQLQSIVGEDWVITQREQMESYLMDETYLGVRPQPADNVILVKPANGQEISSILKLPVVIYRLRIPASIKALPNRVYRTYFIAEYSFLPEPQTDIRKYMGITSISHMRKNSRRSRDINTPRMLVSSSRSQAKYSRGLR